MPDASDILVLCHEDPAAIREALARGQVDAILPAVDSFVDRFHEFGESFRLSSLLQELPEPRGRKSVLPFFYGNVLLHKELLGFRCFTEVGRVLFHSPAVLRSLGFNFRHINQGFYANADVKPFNQEALCDYWGQVLPQDLLPHQEKMAAVLRQHFPLLQDSRTAFMDCFDVRVRRPRGSPETKTKGKGKGKGQDKRHSPSQELHYKICAWTLVADGEVFPLLWNFCVGQEKADLTLGKQLLETAFSLWGNQPFDLLVVDRGFLDGAWMRHLKEHHHLDTVIRLKQDMDAFEDLLGLSKLPDTKWQEADPPKLHQRPQPERHIAGFSDLETWDSYGLAFNACLIRDPYPDQVQYQALISTNRSMTAQVIHATGRSRWDVEEGIMALSRYWNLNTIGPCRPHVGFAQTHFILLGYTLLALFRRYEAERERQVTKPHLTAGRQVVVYWRNSYAIMYPSDVIAIILNHVQVWLDKRDHILRTLRYAEGRPP